MNSVMLSFTKEEQAIVLFLIFSLIAGSFVRLYHGSRGAESRPEVNPEFDASFKHRAGEIDSANVAAVGADDKSAPAVAGTAAVSPHDASSRTAKTKPSEGGQTSYFVVNVNLASIDELQTIPRIGPAMAKRIVDYRTANGGFKNLEDLKKVKGIGEATFNKIRPYVSTR